ncbi:Rv3235 family protein [Streptomyces sp. TR06-5]|uniref:Rv3235 family protein n=1 Tax=unclassified Streptomyces TaxID=2593676 RepID=UPI0039A03A58
MTSTHALGTAVPEPAVPRRPTRRSGARNGPPSRRDPRGPGVRATSGTARRPSAHRWFAEQLVLVLSGRRPVHALLGHLRGVAYDQVCALAATAPLVPRGADRRTAVVASVHGRRVGGEVVEACARIATGGRSRALAFRLEAGEDRRWRCSAVELA